jgi:hypothetical protein
MLDTNEERVSVSGRISGIGEVKYIQQNRMINHSSIKRLTYHAAINPK